MSRNFDCYKPRLAQIGLPQICSDQYMPPERRGTRYFVKSPVTDDRHWSLCIYPDNSFYDFAGGKGGDIISFVSYVRGTDNWTALQFLKSFYGLSDDASETDKEELRRRIQLQQMEKHRKNERFREFFMAWHKKIDQLTEWQQVCRRALDEGIYEPLSEMHGYLIDQLQLADYKLSVLCATDCEAYRRMKPNAEKGLPSDAFQWLLDCIEILKRDGLFTATRIELKEIQTQAAFELVREPGKDRICGLDWVERIWRGGGKNEW